MKDLKVLVHDFTREDVDSVSREFKGPVVTFYFDLDPTSFATATSRKSQLDSLFSRAKELIESDQLSHDEKEALAHRLRWLSDFIERDFLEWASGAEAVVFVAAAGEDSIEAIKCPRSLGSEVFLDKLPRLAPMREQLLTDAWCFTLVDRRAARILLGNTDMLREVAAFEDAVHRQHDEGGWSQANYQRSVEESVDDHLKHLADELFQIYQRNKFEKLIVACADELWPKLENRLHDYLRKRVIARVEMDVQLSQTDEILERAEGILRAEDAREEHQLIEVLSQELGKGGRATKGLDHVLEALNEKKVETLLFEEGYEPSGSFCPNCGWTGTKQEVCPLDGTKLEKVPNVIERAVELGLEQSASVKPIKYDPEKASELKIAALLRY